MQVAIRTHYFTWINVTMIALSIGCWLPALYAFSSIGPLQRTLTDMVELGPHLFKTPAFWLGVVILAPVMALLLDFILSSWQRQRRPLDRQVFQVGLLLSALCKGSNQLGFVQQHLGATSTSSDQ